MKIWGYVMFAVILFGAVFKLIFMGKKFGMAEVTAKVNKKSIDQRQKATEAMIEGLEKEDEVRDAKVDTTKRDHFTRQ